MKSQILKAAILLLSLTAAFSHADSAPGGGVSGANASAFTARPNNASPIPNGKEVVDQFRSSYDKQGKPRLLVYINRDLLPDQRLDVSGKTEKSTQVKGDAVDHSGTTSNVQIGNNTQTSGGGIVLNPRQTGMGGEKKETSTTYTPAAKSNLGVTSLSEFDARQLGETFRRPYFAAGARFVDQKVATALLKSYPATADRFLSPPATDVEKEQLGALKQSADIVIELLGRHYDVTYPTPAGDTTVKRLDLVATAYDLKQPGLILGQISSETLYGFNQPGGTTRAVTDLEIIDQTALALMEQLTAP